jgi:hypothetical protein
MVRLRVGFVSVFCCSLLSMAESGFVPLAELPKDLGLSAEAPKGYESIARDTVRVGEPDFRSASHARTRLTLPGALALRIETLPELPYFEKRFSIPSGSDFRLVARVSEASRSEGAIPLWVVPETKFWSPDPLFRFALPGGSQRYFPGKFAEVVSQPGEAVVHFYPFQWDKLTGELIRVKEIAVELYSKIHESASLATPSPLSVIVVRESQFDMAKDLREYHAKNFGVASEVVTVEQVERAEQEVPEADLPDGYKNRKLGDEAVKPFDSATGIGYRYSTARKLIAYFQSRFGKGLKYITLVGDADAIPPSYYFSVRSGFGAKFGVTDQCYAAVNECLEPRAVVGRLPFVTRSQMKAHLSKVGRWQSQAAKTASELSLFGGKPFDGPFYFGELGTLRTLQSDADWRGVKKYYRTKKNYDRASVLALVRGGSDSSLAFSLDHGGGNRWDIDSQNVTSNEILNASNTGEGVNPAIFSIACSNAAFDESLTQEAIFTDSRAGKVSVGVALLQSVAGAVAYFGSSRPALGAPVFDIDSRGNLELLDSNHAVKLLEVAVENYRRKGEGRLGDFILETLLRYSQDPVSSLSKDRFRWTYFNAAFLGDPVMQMPKRKRERTALPIAEGLDEIEEAFTGYFPLLEMPTSDPGALRFQSATTVEATLFQQISFGAHVVEKVIKKATYAAGLSDIALAENGRGKNHFIRIENKVGAPLERQIWFKVQ